jgi:hypothetical protein
VYLKNFPGAVPPDPQGTGGERKGREGRGRGDKGKEENGGREGTLVAQPDGTRPGPCRCATRVPQGMTAGVPADCDRGIQKGPLRDSRRLTPDGNRLDTVIVTRRVPRGLTTRVP